MISSQSTACTIASLLLYHFLAFFSPRNCFISTNQSEKQHISRLQNQKSDAINRVVLGQRSMTETEALSIFFSRSSAASRFFRFMGEMGQMSIILSKIEPIFDPMLGSCIWHLVLKLIPTFLLFFCRDQDYQKKISNDKGTTKSWWFPIVAGYDGLILNDGDSA